MKRRLNKSLSFPMRALGALAVAGIAALWGPAAQLFRIVEAPAAGSSRESEVRLVVQVLPAPAQPAQGKGKCKPQEKPEKSSSKSVDLIQALNFESEAPAAPRLQAPSLEESRQNASQFQAQHSALALPLNEVLALVYPSLPAEDPAGAWQIVNYGRLYAPRGPPLL